MYNPPILINSYIMYKAILLKQNGNARATFIYINYKLYSPCFKKSNPFYEKWLFFLALSTIIKLVLSKFHNKIRLLCRPATRMVQRKEVIMKFLKQNSVNLLISLCELIIGILLLIDPTSFSNLESLSPSEQPASPLVLYRSCFTGKNRLQRQSRVFI